MLQHVYVDGATAKGKATSPACLDFDRVQQTLTILFQHTSSLVAELSQFVGLPIGRLP